MLNGRPTIPVVKARAMEITILASMAYYAVGVQGIDLPVNTSPSALKDEFLLQVPDHTNRNRNFKREN
jgi:hypothetical protein